MEKRSKVIHRRIRHVCCIFHAVQIFSSDCIGYTVDSLSRIRLSYMPLVRKNVTDRKPVRRLVNTPWMEFGKDMDRMTSSVAAHIDSFVKKKKMLVIVNPKSGPGKGRQVVETEVVPILKMSRSVDFDIRLTQAPKHATEIVKSVTPGQYDVILSAGGDGTFHEVIQGLLDRPDWHAMVESTSLVQVPCGSGNAVAASTDVWNVPSAVYVALRGVPQKMDIASIIQPESNERLYSFLSVTYGMVANLDIGTEHLRWMGGTRFIWGAIREILTQKVYSIDIQFLEGKDTSGDENRPKVPKPTDSTAQYGPRLDILQSLLDSDGCVKKDIDMENKWTTLEGTEVQLCVLSNLPWLDMNFNLAPNARIGSGSFNLLYNIGRQGISDSFKLMKESENGSHMRLIRERKVVAFRMEPKSKDTWLVVDGESVDLSVLYGEVHPGLCTILVPPGQSNI